MKRNTFAAAALLLIIVGGVLSACGTQSGGTARTSTAHVTAVPSPAAPTPGHGGGGLPFTSPVELAHHYNVGVFAPEGIALHGGVTSETDANGALTNYGMGLFNGYGALYVAGPAPATTAEFRTAADDDKQRTILSRTIVKVQGRDAALILERQPGPVGSRDYRLLWAQGGRVLQIIAPEKVGAGAMIAAANATRFFTLAAIDTANIIVDLRPNPAGDAVVYATPAGAAAVLGVPVFAPPTYKRILVRPDAITGKPARWEVEIDDAVYIEQSEQGTIPTDAELQAGHPDQPAVDRIQVAGAPAAFVKRLGAPSKLYFIAKGTALVVVDLSGKRTVNDITSVASAVTPSQPVTPTMFVGTPSLVSGKVQIPISTAGSGFAPYSGFSVHLRWTSSVFSFASANSTGTVIPSPFCPASVPDSDGAGVTYACTSTNAASISTTGLLATIVLTPAASGCSALHLFTFGAPDGGVANDGTYTVDATANAPQTTAYVDGSANVAGQGC